MIDARRDVEFTNLFAGVLVNIRADIYVNVCTSKAGNGADPWSAHVNDI